MIQFEKPHTSTAHGDNLTPFPCRPLCCGTFHLRHYKGTHVAALFFDIPRGSGHSFLLLLVGIILFMLAAMFVTSNVRNIILLSLQLVCSFSLALVGYGLRSARLRLDRET